MPKFVVEQKDKEPEVLLALRAYADGDVHLVGTVGGHENTLLVFKPEGRCRRLALGETFRRESKIETNSDGRLRVVDL